MPFLPIKNLDLNYSDAGTKLLTLLIPEKSEITSSTLSLAGKPLEVTIELTDNITLTDFDPPPDSKKGEIKGSSVIVNFHQMRTLCGIEIGISAKKASDLTGLICVLRIWGGTQWYLPLPKNILKFKTATSIVETLPPIKADKILLSFIKLVNPEGTAKNIDISKKPINNLMEIMNFTDLKAVEKEVVVTVKKLAIKTKDNLSSVTLGAQEKPPIFIEAGDFVAEEEKAPNLQDMSPELNQLITSKPLIKKEQLGVSPNIKKNLRANHYHLIDFIATSATSGILSLNNLNLGHIFRTNEFSTTQDLIKNTVLTLDFQHDKMKSRITSKLIYIDLPEQVTVKEISFNIKGSLASEKRIEPENILPTGSGTNMEIGVQAYEGTSLFSIFRATCLDYNFTALEIRIKPLSDNLKLKVSILKDLDNQPELQSEPLLSATTEYSFEEEARDYRWIKIDFSDQDFIMGKDVIYWLSLEVIEGELSWQADKTKLPDSTQVNVYRKNKSGELQSCGPHINSSINLIARFYYLPDSFDDYLTVKIAGGKYQVSNLDDINKIDAFLKQKKLEILHKKGLFIIELLSQSEGYIELSDFLLKFEDKKNQIFLTPDPLRSKTGT